MAVYKYVSNKYKSDGTTEFVFRSLVDNQTYIVALGDHVGLDILDLNFLGQRYNFEESDGDPVPPVDTGNIRDRLLPYPTNITTMNDGQVLRKLGNYIVASDVIDQESEIKSVLDSGEVLGKDAGGNLIGYTVVLPEQLDSINTSLANKLDSTLLDQPNGVAQLDINRRYRIDRLPSEVVLTDDPRLENTESGAKVHRPARMAIIGTNAELAYGVPGANPVLVSGATNVGVRNAAAALSYWINGSVDVVYNGSNASETSADIYNRMNAAIATAGGDIGYWVIGCPYQNDFSMLSTSQSQSNMQAIFDRIGQERGFKLICTLGNRDAGMNGTLPKSGGGFYSASEYAERVRALDKFVRDYARNNYDFILVDMHAALTRDNVYRAGYTTDGTLTSNRGADLQGRAIARAIKNRVTPDNGLALAADNSVPFGDGYFFKGGTSNEVQAVNVGGASGGTFTLTIPANNYGVPAGTTTAIPYNFSASALQAALNVILGAGSTSVSGTAVTFTGDYAGKSMPTMTLTSSLTGATSPGVTRVTLGGIANGWTGTFNAGVRYYTEDREDGFGKWQVIDIVANASTGVISRSIGTSFAAGTKMYAEAELRADSVWNNPQFCELVLNPTTPSNVLAHWFRTQDVTPDPGSFNPGPSQGVARTPIIQASGSTSWTAGNLNVNFKADAGSKLYIGRCGTRKVL